MEMLMKVEVEISPGAVESALQPALCVSDSCEVAGAETDEIISVNDISDLCEVGGHSDYKMEVDVCDNCVTRLGTIEMYRKLLMRKEKKIVLMQKKNVKFQLQIQKLNLKNLSRQSKCYSRKSRKQSNFKINNIINRFKNVSQNGNTFAKIIVKKKKLYTEKEKNLTQSVDYKSPACYLHMRETMKICLPSQSAIKSCTKLKFIDPGFNVEVLKYLKEKVQGMSTTQRVAVLLLDEISIKKEANYNVVWTVFAI